MNLDSMNIDSTKIALGTVHQQIMDSFGGLYGTCAAAMFILTILAVLSPLSKIRIGGPEALPVMSTWRWIATSVTSTVAAGLFFWSAAEPVAHLASPSPSSGDLPFSLGASSSALGHLYLHWTLVPYAIYVVPSLVFAIAHYNRGAAPGVCATHHGAVPAKFANARGIGNMIEKISMISLTLGIAASVGTGILMITRGATILSDLAGSQISFTSMFNITTILLIATCAIVIMAGRNHGIGRLASINSLIFIAIAVVVLAAGPTSFIASQSKIGMQKFFSGLFSATSGSGREMDRAWRQDWTLFYWTAWIAWAPVTALFLGGIARGRTVRAFLTVNFLIPAIFTGIWMSIFGSTVLYLQTSNGMPLAQEFQKTGADAVVYMALGALPYANTFRVIFTILAFMSLVSLGSSALASLTGMSSGKTRIGQQRGTVTAWSLIISVIIIVTVNGSGIDGVRMLANLGAFPMLFLQIMSGVALTILLLDPSRARWQDNKQGRLI